jgi:L-lactate dehydrogenase
MRTEAAQPLLARPEVATARIGIIGVGWVGASAAISTLQSGVASELLMHDARQGIAEAEAMDLSHGSSFYPPARVRAARLDEMLDTDAVVIAAGRASKPGQSRLDLLRDNAALTRELGARFAGYRGLVVLVTNPVDVLAFLFQRASGLPPERVLGTGTLLDTARLRQVVGRELGVDARSVHAQVVGEHGDSEVVLWSSATAGGISLRNWPGWRREREEALATEVRTAAYEIIRRKGATNHAIGLVSAALLRWMLRGESRVITVSRVQADGSVALSLPCVVGAGGATHILTPAMDNAERAALERSAGVLRKAIAEAQ